MDKLQNAANTVKGKFQLHFAANVTTYWLFYLQKLRIYTLNPHRKAFKVNIDLLSFMEHTTNRNLINKIH